MIRVSRKLLLREFGPTLLPLEEVHTLLQGLLNNCWTAKLYLLSVGTAVYYIGQGVKYFTPAGMVFQLMPRQFPVIIFTVFHPLTSLHFWIGIVIRLLAGQLWKHNSIRDTAKKHFCTWGLPTLLFSFIWRSVFLDEAAGLWNWPHTPSSAKIRNEWGQISTFMKYAGASLPVIYPAI
jgi:hypothetical protein